MPPCALLLSPDDQAVAAITGVLQELSVDCQRPLDGASAAKKLNSQSFDLVLVDCDNLPAAKLIFDVCRRSHAGTSIPIAIVDGRAGLPTAFRLGAELILTKPVAKDQARNTIGTAVSRLRKEEPVRSAKPVEAAPAGVPTASEPEALAHAAAAGAEQSPVMDLATTVAAIIPAPSAPPTTAISSPATEAALATFTPAPVPDSTASFEISSAPLTVKSTPSPALRRSDLPVLAELERPETAFDSPIFSSYEQRQRGKKGHGLLIAALVSGAMGGGFYAAWMYQPGFRSMVQVQLDRGMVLAGLQSQPEATATRPVVNQTPQKASVPSAASQPAATSAGESSSANASSPGTASAPANLPVQQAASAAMDASVASDLKKGNSVPTFSETGQSEEKDTVVLSSKGAERRLIHRVAPAYPVEARSQRAEGTIVLRTVVGENGVVETVRLVEGNPTLAAAAMSAVKQWRYKPYVRDGKAQRFQTIVLVDFQ